MAEPTNEEIAEALRSIEGLPLGTRLIVRLAADRLSPRAEEYDFGDDPDRDPWVGEDGWIEWNGGECPVPPETVVEVKYRDGVQDVPFRIPNKGSAREYSWWGGGNGSDIITYRIPK